MPVFGRVLVGAGELADGGAHSRGITLQTMPDQIVVAPKGGKVAYAGGFRSYGEVVIIDHGRGLISTLTGLAALRVRQGERVRPGDPIGRSGDRMTVELWADGRPVPIAGLIAPVVR